MDKMEKKIIKSICWNTKTGSLLVQSFDNNRKRSLMQDSLGYFLKRHDSPIIDRITNKEDLIEIAKYI